MMVEGDDGPKSNEEVVDWFEKQRLQGSVHKRSWKQQTGAEVQALDHLKCKHTNREVLL